MGKEYTESQKRASLKYQSDKAQIKITVTREQRERYQKHAEHQRKTLTALICDLIEDDIKKS